jgi:phosphoglycerol transferase MdoB-like AlkP superfamily enzyme
MNTSQEPDQNPIGDFVDDEKFYRYRKALDRLDKPIMIIYLFATFSLLVFVFYMILHYQTLDWFSVVLSLAGITIYYCLAFYSRQQPFTAFISLIIFETSLMAWNFIASAEPTIRGMILPIALIVAIALRLEDAKFVQAHQKEMPKSELKF